MSGPVEIIRAADVVATMGCGDACPLIPGQRCVDGDVIDPAGLPVEDIRPIRDDLGWRLRRLMMELELRPLTTSGNATPE